MFLLCFFIYLLINFLILSILVYKGRIVPPDGVGELMFSLLLFPAILFIVSYMDYICPFSIKMKTYLDNRVINFFDWLKKWNFIYLQKK